MVQKFIFCNLGNLGNLYCLKHGTIFKADFRKMSSDKNLTGFENLSGLGQNIYLKDAAINRAMFQTV